MRNITANYKFTTPLYNRGANESNIQLQKEQFMMHTFRKHLDLISTNKHYPIEDVLEIDLSLDIVILKKSEYDKLIQEQDVKL